MKAEIARIIASSDTSAINNIYVREQLEKVLGLEEGTLVNAPKEKKQEISRLIDEVLDENERDEAEDQAPLSARKPQPKDPIFLGSCVLVTGDTQRVRDKLTSIGGGEWLDSLRGWVFPEEMRDAVRAAVPEAVAETAATGGGGASSNEAAPKPSVGAGAVLTIGPHKRAILVTGDTLKVKEQLKRLGGSWNRALKGWIFKPADQDKVVDCLRGDPTNTVNVGGGGQPSKKRKAEKAQATCSASDDDDSE